MSTFEKTIDGLYFLGGGIRNDEYELWQGKISGVITSGENPYNTVFLVDCEAWEGDRAMADRFLMIDQGSMLSWNLYATRAEMLADRDRVLAQWEAAVAKRKEREAQLYPTPGLPEL